MTTYGQEERKYHLRLIATTHINHHIINQGCQGAESSYYISISGRLQGVFCGFVIIAIGDTCTTHPSQGTLAGIDFHRKGDETEQGRCRKQNALSA